MNQTLVAASAVFLVVLSTACCTQLLGAEDPRLLDADAPPSVPLPTCPDGRASCRGQQCDTNLTNDNDHCGACGVRCATVDGTSECRAGRCIVTCTRGRADCNQNQRDGCETDVLSNPDHCGTCGQSCFGAPCENGECLPMLVAEAKDNVTQIVADNARVYWVSKGGLEAVTLSGGAPTTLLAGPTTQLAERGGLLYVAHESGTVPPVQLSVIARNGLTRRCLARTESVSTLALSPTSAGWAAAGGLVGGAPLMESVGYAGDCSGASAQVVPLVLANERVVAALASDGMYAYAGLAPKPGATTPSATLTRVDLATGAETVLVQGAHPAGGGSIAVDATHVYWADAGVFVRRVPKAGCQAGPTCVEELYSADASTVATIAVDDRHVYALANQGDLNHLLVIDRLAPERVRRIDAHHVAVGASPVPEKGFGGIALNETLAFWSIGTRIYRIAR